VERLEAAIAKLEQLKADSTPGPWGWRYSSEWGGRVLARQSGVPQKGVVVSGRVDLAGDCTLIVTLHQTIDAQLDLLRLTRAYLGAGMTGPDSSNAFAALGGALCDAILGDNS